MSDPTPQRIPPPVERLGAALELMAQYCNPSSGLRLGAMLDGEQHIIDRFREFLDRERAYQTAEGRVPGQYGATQPLLVKVFRSQIPWPLLATEGLQPADIVEHEQYGRGVVAGFDDEDWAKYLPVVAQGRLLVIFEDGQHWVPADSCSRPQHAAPCVDQDSPF